MEGDCMTAKSVVDLQKWKHAAITEVKLSSGAGTIRQRPGTLPQAIRGGRVPNPLVPVAMKIEYEGVDPKKLTPEEAADFEAFKDWYVAETVVEPVITAEDVAGLPPGDREQLWLNALHVFDIEKLGKLVASIAELEPFREGAGRDTSPADGDGAAEAAV